MCTPWCTPQTFQNLFQYSQSRYSRMHQNPFWYSRMPSTGPVGLCPPAQPCATQGDSGSSAAQATAWGRALGSDPVSWGLWVGHRDMAGGHWAMRESARGGLDGRSCPSPTPQRRRPWGQSWVQAGLEQGLSGARVQGAEPNAGVLGLCEHSRDSASGGGTTEVAGGPRVQKPCWGGVAPGGVQGCGGAGSSPGAQGRWAVESTCSQSGDGGQLGATTPQHPLAGVGLKPPSWSRGCESGLRWVPGPRGARAARAAAASPGPAAWRWAPQARGPLRSTAVTPNRPSAGLTGGSASPPLALGKAGAGLGGGWACATACPTCDPTRTRRHLERNQPWGCGRSCSTCCVPAWLFSQLGVVQTFIYGPDFACVASPHLSCNSAMNCAMYVTCGMAWVSHPRGTRAPLCSAGSSRCRQTPSPGADYRGRKGG